MILKRQSEDCVSAVRAAHAAPTSTAAVPTVTRAWSTGVDRLSLDAAYLSRQTAAILGGHERNCSLCQFNGDCGDDCIYITAARLFGAVFGEGEHE